MSARKRLLIGALAVAAVVVAAWWPLVLLAITVCVACFRVGWAQRSSAAVIRAERLELDLASSNAERDKARQIADRATATIAGLRADKAELARQLGEATADVQ